MRPSLRATWLLAALIALLLVMAVAPAAQAAPPPAPAASSCGYWYTVQPGDTWYKLSAHTGISVAALQAANPAHIHPNNWLYVGHVLWIPAGCPPPPPPPPPGCGYWYMVQHGDSWTHVSWKTGVSISALQAANPGKVRPPSYWLYAGESLWIPCGPPPPPACLYWYTVHQGDSWSSVSAMTGAPVHMLQAANPSKVRPPRYWLYIGDILCIPDP